MAKETQVTKPAEI